MQATPAPASPQAPRRSRRGQPPRKLVEHALSLIGRQQHGDDIEAISAELAAWRTAHPSHEAAYELASHYWQATDANALRDDVPLPRSQSARDLQTRHTRRRVLTVLGVGGLVAALGGGRWAWLQPLQQIAMRTVHDQQFQRNLPDGSHIAMAANTVAEVTYYRNRREVRLGTGEMRFEVQRDADRPFIVATRWGRVQVLGTVFSVSVREERMSVEVAEGRVAVWASNRDGAGVGAGREPDMVLTAGQAVATDPRGIGARTPVSPDSVGAWREGWLVFNGTPLREAIARWNDYVGRPMRVDNDPMLLGLRLTGTFPLRDPEAFVQNLPRMLPVRVARQDGVVTIQARN